MSESKHTPGPWVAEIGGQGSFMIEDSNARVLCQRAAWYSSMVDESEANARLIAAAPDLLAALIAIADQLERVGDTRRHKDGQYIDEARAAIAKAEGRS
jgi:hypothetical protein